MRALTARRKLAATVLEASARVVGCAADTSLDLRIHSPASETFTGRARSYCGIRQARLPSTQFKTIASTGGCVRSQLNTTPRDAVSLLAAVQTPISEAMDMRVGADPAVLGKIGHRYVQQHAGVTRLALGESIAYANTGCTCGQNGRTSGYASAEHRGHSSC